MLKKLFNVFSGPRFIDIHGRPWHKSGMADTIMPAYLVIAGAALSGIFYSAAAAPDMLASTLRPATSASIMGGLLYLAYRIRHRPLLERLSAHAIDCEGTSTPPAHNPSLLQTTAYVRDLTIAAGVGYLLGTGTGYALLESKSHTAALPAADMASLIKNNAGFALTFLACNFGYPAAAFFDTLRMQKLINGTYTFCGTPPAEPKKESAGVTLAVAKPSVA